MDLLSFVLGFVCGLLLNFLLGKIAEHFFPELYCKAMNQMRLEPKGKEGGYNSGQKVTEQRNFLLGWFRNWMETYFETNLKLGELGAFQADVDAKIGEVTEYLLSSQNALKVLGAVIFRQGDLQQVDISKITGIEKSHVSELCAELAARGLIDKRKMDVTDLAMEFYNKHKELFKPMNKLEIHEVKL